MKRAHLAWVASALLSVPSFSGGCTPNPLVVVENEGGSKGDTSDAGTGGNTEDGGTGGNTEDVATGGNTEDVGTGGNTEDAGAHENDGGVTTNDAGVCVPNGITFHLTVGTTDKVWLEGPTPPWPAASFGCPSWLTLTAPGAGSPWGNPQAVSINVAKGGCGAFCPAAQPAPAADQSFTWDGTYYPLTNSPDPNSACDTPACAPPGVYGVTMCVGYAGQDSGLPEGAPTCQSFSFTWPPATPSEATVQTTITPTLGGG